MSHVEYDVVRSCAAAGPASAARTSATRRALPATSLASRPPPGLPPACERRRVVGCRRRPAPHLPHAEPARTPQEIGALAGEGLDVRRARLRIGGRRDHRVDDRGREILPDARVAAREAELEPAL